ncbi:hypothetical protein [Salinigranum salinum]|uniref:hypothetical protein n=1 Tax=Salinigranum salinum TaxID=1364937 RepID=UPI001F04EC55|nr:hypothetical protein [Salinigranum salinum]
MIAVGCEKVRVTCGFVLSSGVVVAAVVYVSGPADAGVVTSLVIGTVVFLVFSVALTVSSGRVKEILLELLSLLP